MAAHSDSSLVPVMLPPGSTLSSYELLTSSVYKNLQAKINALTEADIVKKLIPANDFLENLHDLLHGILGRTFVICIDGFDSLLQPLIREGVEDEIQKIIWVIDTLIRERQNLGINLFITLSTIPNALRRPNVPNKILETSRLLEVAPFLEVETSEMLQSILEPHVEISKKAIDRMYYYSGGNPYIVKLILDTLLQQEDFIIEPKEITQSWIDQVTKLAANNIGNSIVFQNTFENHFSIQERALALLMTQADRPIKTKEIKLLGAQFITAANSLARRYYFRKNEQGFSWHIHFIPEWMRGWDRYDEEMELLKIPDLLDTLSVDIWIDKTTNKVFFRQELLHLPNRQYEILECLCIHTGKLVTYEQITSYLWHADDLDTNASIGAISMAISRLRKQFNDNSRSPRYIETVPAQGYILRRAGFNTEYHRL